MSLDTDFTGDQYIIPEVIGGVSILHADNRNYCHRESNRESNREYIPPRKQYVDYVDKCPRNQKEGFVTASNNNYNQFQDPQMFFILILIIIVLLSFITGFHIGKSINKVELFIMPPLANSSTLMPV